MSYIHLSLIRKLWIVNIILIHFVRVDEIVTSVQVRSAPTRVWWRAASCGVMPRSLWQHHEEQRIAQQSVARPQRAPPRFCFAVINVSRRS